MRVATHSDRKADTIRLTEIAKSNAYNAHNLPPVVQTDVRVTGVLSGVVGSGLPQGLMLLTEINLL